MTDKLSNVYYDKNKHQLQFDEETRNMIKQISEDIIVVEIFNLIHLLDRKKGAPIYNPKIVGKSQYVINKVQNTVTEILEYIENGKKILHQMDDLTLKEMIAESLTQEVRSWAIGKPEPPKDTYRCLICGFSILGEENCVNHILEEHDAELQAEMEMNNYPDEENKK